MTSHNTKSLIVGISIGIIIGSILIYFLIEIKNKCYIKTDSKTKLNKIIEILVRQTSRWATAAKQDDNILISVLHANYAAGYLWALRDIASDEEIETATNIKVSKFIQEITKIQDNSTKSLALACKDYAPRSDYLSMLAGEGV